MNSFCQRVVNFQGVVRPTTKAPPPEALHSANGHGNGNAVGPTSALAGLCLAAVRSLGMRLVHMVRVTYIRRYKKIGYKTSW